MSRPYNRTDIKADSAVDYAREYNRRLYASRKAAGLCVSCGLPSRKGMIRCASCARHYSWQFRLRTQDRKAAGLCVWCSKPAQEGKTLCPACLEKARARGAASRAKKAEVGE